MLQGDLYPSRSRTGGPVCMLITIWANLFYSKFHACLTLCNPVDCSPPGPSVQGILQARILERGAPLAVQWLRVRLLRQGTWIQSRAGKSLHAAGQALRLHTPSLCPATREAPAMRSHAPHRVAPARRNGRTWRRPSAAISKFFFFN